MRTASAIGYPTYALERRHGARAPLVSLGARVRAAPLDRELARGVPTWASPAHAARALQLTDRRHRATLADSLERIADHASRPRADFVASTVVAPCREQVWDAMPQLLEIASCLRGPSPVAARGMALLIELLRDGSGPCYQCTHRRALVRALRLVARHLGAEE
ncbi:MAG: hypothetical protein ACRDLP_16550 [Solirubrobacteraceae bacterium]